MKCASKGNRQPYHGQRRQNDDYVKPVLPGHGARAASEVRASSGLAEWAGQVPARAGQGRQAACYSMIWTILRVPGSTSTVCWPITT